MKKKKTQPSTPPNKDEFFTLLNKAIDTPDPAVSQKAAPSSGGYTDTQTRPSKTEDTSAKRRGTSRQSNVSPETKNPQ